MILGAKEAMDFFDEYWFFQNILNRAQTVDISCPSKSKEAVVTGSSRQRVKVTGGTDSTGDQVATLALLRTQSAIAPFNLSISKIQYSCSSLDEHQSYSSSKQRTTPSPSSTRHQPPRDTKDVEGSSRQGRNNDGRKPFQEKKWKSLSDLECFEVQGFKDLGFVFDKEGLNARLVKVIPGLRDRRPAEDDEKVRRPYLSEAWLVRRLSPPVLGRVNRGSAEDMKEQLRFWARAVACNVRQEC